MIMVINGIGLVAFRDPNGIRPLCYGSRRNATGLTGTDYAIASESVAIDILGPQFHFDRDVKPGEAIFISTETGLLHTEIVHPNPALNPCLFEYVYFARPDSVSCSHGMRIIEISGVRSISESLLNAIHALS